MLISKGRTKLRKLICIFLLVCFLLLPDMNLKVATASTSPVDSADLEAFLDTIITEQMDEFNRIKT